MKLLRLTTHACILAALFCLAGCATTARRAESSLAGQVAAADREFEKLQAGPVAAYNRVVGEMALTLQKQSPAESGAALSAAGVRFEMPDAKLPFVRCHVVARKPARVESQQIGVPVVLEYDTQSAPLHPPEGMLLPATALYTRQGGERRFAFVTDRSAVTVNGRTFPLAIDHAAPGLMLARRARRLARSGFMSMIRPARMERRPQVYLIDPYDPNKIPVLMVHGLQSTPVAFARLVNAFHAEPEIRQHFQIWQFHYASGAPVLVNAALLRDELARAIREVDPRDRHAATKRIVVLGHSMGGVISHTLVSSSGDKLWNSLFTRAPRELAGDLETRRGLERVMFFRRNSRVTRVVFMATPHLGSPMADTWIGAIAKSLSRVPAVFESGLTGVARANADAMTPEGAAFYNGERFTAVRTLSARNPSLLALAKLPIEVPFHSIMGQKSPGPRERGSDGVVPYARSHLPGAASEVVVPSGHMVFNNPDAVHELIRILRLELRSAGRASPLKLPQRGWDVRRKPHEIATY